MDPKCGHRDCEESRKMAAVVCRICKKQIGYERRLFNDGPSGGYDLVHELCAYEEMEER